MRRWWNGALACVLSVALVGMGVPTEALAEIEDEASQAIEQVLDDQAETPEEVPVAAPEEDAPEAEVAGESDQTVPEAAVAADEIAATDTEAQNQDQPAVVADEQQATEDEATQEEVVDPDAYELFVPSRDLDEIEHHPAISDGSEPQSLEASDGEPEELGASHSGSTGTCNWSINSSGHLTISPKGSTGYLASDPWATYSDSIKSVYVSYGVYAYGTGAGPNLFSGYKNMTSCNISNLRTPDLTSLKNCFNGCNKLTSLTVPSKWVTSKVTNLNSVFYDCTSMGAIDLSSWDTSGVTDMGSMFYNCTSMVSAKLGKLNVSKVRDMSWMFANCTSLTSIDLSSWRPSALVDASYMLGGCQSLKTANLASWPCSKLTTVESMFQADYALETIDLSGWTCSALTTATNCFKNDNSLKSWTISNSWPVNLKGAVPTATASNGKWYSTRSKAWYSTSQIASNRRKTADTYITQARAVVYRMYNTKTSEHLYTMGLGEYNACGTGNYRDWRAEGVGWYAPASSSTPVWRLYNRKSGDHHYTTSKGERDILIAKHGWTLDLNGTPAFYSGGNVALYRLYNGRLKRGQHHYTSSAAERDSLVKNNGWRYESIAFYGYKL